MQNTKHDLSAGEVKLDYEALIRTAGIAYCAKKNAIGERLGELSDCDMKGENTSRYLTAHYLKQDAEALAIAAETYSTLLEGKKRDSVIIVNKEF